MKKLLLTLAVTGVCTVTFAQGLINFGNGFSGTTGRFPIYGLDPGNPNAAQTGQSSLGVPAGTTVYGGPLLQGAGYTLALFAGASSITDVNNLTFVTSAGFRTAANPTALPAGLVNTVTIAMPGLLPGSTAAIEFRAWDNKGGTITTWAQAIADPTVALGRSGRFVTGPLGGTDTGGTVYLTPYTLAQSFSLAIIPEPSTFALAGLAGAALLIFRRRN